MKLKDISITVSSSNRKLGNIPNISTVPVADCGNCEACRTDCYALKAYRQYPNVRKAWKGNSKAFRKDRVRAFNDLHAWFKAKRKSPKFFRIHVAGDFLDQDHVAQWADFAGAHPETRFLAFTKMHDLDYSNLPENMTVILSMWTGLPEPDSGLPKAWVNDGVEDRIPKDAIVCPGHCESCGMCWNLPNIGLDVVFDIH